MAAVTPDAKNHQGLGRLSSRFVEVDALPWRETRFPGVEIKTLLRGPGNRAVDHPGAHGARRLSP